MSETSSEPPPPPETEPPAEPTAPFAAERVRRPLPVGGIFGVIVILLLLGAGGEYYLWHQEIAGQRQQTVALNGEIDALKSRMAQLSAQVAAEKTPPPVKIPAALTGRIDGLQQNVKALASRLGSDNAADAHLRSQVQPRLDALGAQVGKLQTHLGALDSLDSKLSASQSDLKPRLDDLDKKITALQTHVGALDSNLGDLQANLKSQGSTLNSKIAGLQSKVGNTEQLASRAQRLDRLAMASLALQTGQSLGAIKDAPPALARFAATPPPTEAELRQEFPGAAARAIGAGGEVQSKDNGYWQRLKMRVAGLVTLRKGDQVLVGSQVSGVVAAAQGDLDAGNLQKAVDALQTLSPQAKAAMQGWLDQANSLIAARQALASMAEQG